MTDWVEDVADEFAAAGYIAIAPDLLSGMGPNGGGTIDFAAAVSDPRSANSIRRPDHGRPERSRRLRDETSCLERQALRGGFCYGGGQASAFATNRPDLSRRVCLLRRPPASGSMARITAPVYGFYAGNDARIGATIPAAKEADEVGG